MATLLFELQYIFSEFKKHEEIEDTYIVDELKSRMTQGAQQRSLVGAATAPEASSLALATHTPEQHEQDAPISLEKDLHGDDRLTSVIHVISNVQDVTGRATCNRVVRLRQGQRLCEVLDEFTVDFVPHMAEEEQVNLCVFFLIQACRVVCKVVCRVHGLHVSTYTGLHKESSSVCRVAWLACARTRLRSSVHGMSTSKATHT